MTAPIDIYRIIEESLASYTERETKKLVNESDLSDSKLHAQRGKLQACRDLSSILRSALNYSPSDL